MIAPTPEVPREDRARAVQMRHGMRAVSVREADGTIAPWNGGVRLWLAAEQEIVRRWESYQLRARTRGQDA